MFKRSKNEKGVALAIAIFALVIIGGLVSSAFFLGMQEQAVGRNTLQYQQAFAAADGGAQTTLAFWNPLVNNQLAIGDSTTFSGWLNDSLGWYRGSIVRTSPYVFLVRSEGFSRDSSTRQQVGALVRIRPFEISITSALKTQGATKLGGSTDIDGGDMQPSGWSDCGDLSETLPGLITTDTSQITVVGGSLEDYLDGDPLVVEDTTITSDSLSTFGELDIAAFKSIATWVLTPGSSALPKPQPAFNSDGSCNVSLNTNWGDPGDHSTSTSYSVSNCSPYYPLIFVDGSAKLQGGMGQGVLVVAGDLQVSGGFEFYGPVIVQGQLSTSGSGGHFFGGVIAANVNLDQNTILGDAQVNYSQCALDRARNGSATAYQMRERSWVNIN